MNIGIYSVSSQSGGAFLVDMIKQNRAVYGYARTSPHGKEFIAKVNQKGGVDLIRPKENRNLEESGFIPLGHSQVGHNLKTLVDHSDLIVICHPSQYLLETIQRLKKAGIAKKRVPIVLSPPRTFAVPYLWDELGAGYPFVSFATCPYSCKVPNPGTVLIKRRKRNWIASLEGAFTEIQVQMLEDLFPQAIFNGVPATTSIGNIGAVLHPTPYLMNYKAIKQFALEGKVYNFYMEGIAANTNVAHALEKIDQVRLKIAKELGLQVFGLKEDPQEEEWETLINKLRAKEAKHEDDLADLRLVRHDHLVEICHAITSVQHWLDYTYGVSRVKGESLQSAIARTPTYQKNSVPQSRYVNEDVPTGIVPLLNIANRLGIDSTPLKKSLALYHQHFTTYKNNDWRDLERFSTGFIVDYLVGKFSNLS